MTPFNLVDEPWIPVLTIDGRQQQVGIREAINDADRFTGIAAELPTVSMAIQRLLQAVLLRVPTKLPRTVEARARLWGDWWDSGGLPRSHVDAYLNRWHDHFDLFHPQIPFFQVPGLHLKSGSGSGLVKLIADVPAGTKFFVTRTGAAIECLSFAEAAQWVVHAQAFDCSGIKSGVVGDDRVSGGKSYSFGYPAWAGNLGIVALEGGSLAETLLLNLVLSATSEDDEPAWETAPQRIASDAIYPTPIGAAQAWTWPSRMIRLIGDDDAVIDVVLSNGEKLGPQNRFREEPMTSWRHSEPQTKKFGYDVLMPLTHNPERSAWRGLSGLLAESPRGEDTKARPAGVLEWLGLLRNAEIIPDTMPVDLRCVAMIYGGNASTFERDFNDVVPATVAALTSHRLRRIAVDAVESARSAVYALRDFAKNVALAAGDSGDQVAPRAAAVELQAYDGLHPEFDAWLSSLVPESTDLEASTAWQQTVSRVLQRVAADHTRLAPTSAVFGRSVTINNKEVHMDLGRAGIWFRSGLRKALPLAHPVSTQEGNDDAVTDQTD